MDRPSPALVAALCLLVVGAGLVAVAAGDLTDYSGPLTYSVEETDGEVSRYAALSGPGQDLVDAGTDRDGVAVTGVDRDEAVAVDELPPAFESGAWNFVRRDGELVCLLPSEDADTGEFRVAFADGEGFAFEYEALPERGRILFTAATERPDGRVSYAGPIPEGFEVSSFYGPELAEAPAEGGLYYVFANGRAYEFEVHGQGPWGGFPSVVGDCYLIALGLALVGGGAYGYATASVRAPAAAAVGASVYLVPPLVEAAGLIRWSIRLDGHHYAVPSVIALAVGGATYALLSRLASPQTNA